MALAVKQGTPDTRVSERGVAKRAQRQLKKSQQHLDSLEKIDSRMASSVLLTTPSKAIIKNLAKSKKPQAPKPVTQPKAKVKVLPKAVSKPTPVKVEAKKATTRKHQRRTDKVAALIAMPERSLVTAPTEGETYLHVGVHGDIVWTQIESKANLEARAFDHNAYMNNQDERDILSLLPEYTRSQTGKHVKQKGRAMVDVHRTNALHQTLERLATFNCVSHLTDDNKQYEQRYVYSKNNITVGGVRMTLGDKREVVNVRCSHTSVKAEGRYILDRVESIRSRTPSVTQADVGLATDFDEDLPPWTDYALDAVKTVADAIGRGYGSLEREFDAPYKYEYDPFSYHHIPRGVNVSEMLDAEQVYRNRYMNGLADLPTGAPQYLVDEVLGQRSSNDDGPPLPPSPAAVMPEGATLTGDALDEELRAAFARMEEDSVPTQYRHLSDTLVAKRNFRRMESLRLSRELSNDLQVGIMQRQLELKEQTYPSDPRNEGDRYYKWLELNETVVERDRCMNITDEDLQYHLKHMETQRAYDDTFGVVHQSASYVQYKPYTVPRERSLSTERDNNYLDPPSTGAVSAATGPGIVGQEQPDFLSVGDVIVPFTKGTNILAGVSVPLKSRISRISGGGWFIPLPEMDDLQAFG